MITFVACIGAALCGAMIMKTRGTRQRWLWIAAALAIFTLNALVVVLEK